MLHTNLKSTKKFFEYKHNLIFLGILFISLLGVLIIGKLIAASDFSWNFSNAGDYTVSDSNKIEVASGEAHLKLATSQILDDSSSEFNLGTYLNTAYSSNRLTLSQTPYTDSASISGLIARWQFENNWSDSVGSNNGTAGGNATLSTAQKKLGSYAAKFDGSGDYTQFAYQANTTNLTYEMWAYWLGTTSAGQMLFYNGTAAGPTFGFGLSINSGVGNAGSLLTILMGGVGWNPTSSTFAMRTNQWYHIALTRDTTTWKIYVNGNVVNTGTNNPSSPGTGMFMGATNASGSYSFNGYLDDFQIYNRPLTNDEIMTEYHKGIGLYGEYTSKIYDTSASEGVTWQNIDWTPDSPYGKSLPDSNQSESAYSSNNVAMNSNVALWHFENNFNDASGNGHNLTTGAGSPGYTTTYPKAGSYSGSFNGSSYLSAGDPVDGSLDFGTGTFSLSSWVRTVSTSSQYMIHKYLNSAPYAGYALGMTGFASFWVGDNSAGWLNDNVSIADGSWHLVTGTYDGSIARLYVDGVLKAAGARTSSASTTASLSIGAQYTSTGYFNGSIDEVGIWNRQLSQNEITAMYVRGANRLKYQVRSCDDNSCSGESFIGPDGTSNTYYSELNNTNLTLPTFSLTNVSDNRYFQYKAILESDDTSYLPKVANNTFQYESYPTDNPFVYSSASRDITSIPISIDHFCEGTLDGSGNCTTTSTKPANTEIYYQICNDSVSNCNTNNTWKYWDGATWSNASSSQYNTASTINSNISSYIPTSQYFAFKAFLSSGGQSTPVLTDLSIDATLDTTNPDVNASSVNISGVSEASWLNYKPTLNWNPGSDSLGGIGLLGYCVSLDGADIDSSTSLDPEITGGVLGGLDDGVSNNYCPYIVTGTSLNLNTVSGLSLTSGKQYYFSIKAVDIAGNIWSGASNEYQDLFSFKYDNVAPSNPAFISMPSNFISTKDVTITWPTSGGQEASDSDSGLAGLQYKIGSSGTWWGYIRNDYQDLTDLLTNNGVYVTDATYDYPLLSDGINIIYFRTLDNAGNVSSSTISGALKLNTSSPGEVQNLSVTPSDNTSNSYSFSWDAPVIFSGEQSNLTYCYSINAVPTSLNCTYTSAGITSLSADAFANQPGSNIFYVVARDEALNINYATYSTIEFTYSGSAPGIPLNLDVADISTKNVSDWKLAVTWSEPSNIGAGISKYKIYRAIGTNINCNSDFGSFSEIGTSTNTSYINTGLTQQDYSYCVRACDSANSCSAVSNTESKYPEGKYTEPANLVSGPNVGQITNRKAVIDWSTDRRSDSKIQFGKAPNTYFEEEVSKSNQITGHVLTLNNLEPGTKYYYRAKWTDEDGNTGISEEKSFSTTPAPIVKDISISIIGVDYALIKFTTVNASSVKIYYGNTISFGGLQSLNTSSQENKSTVQLAGLADGTKYYYKINTLDEDGYEYDGNILDLTTIARPRISNVTIEEVKDTAQPTIKVEWISNTAISSIISFFPSDNASLVRDSVVIDPVTEHSMEITGLVAKTTYNLTLRGVDNLGNEASSDLYQFTTATDSRAPKISNIKVEGLINDTSENNNAQLIVSWETDELSTSQVDYGEGSTPTYSQSTQIDRTIGYKHVVIISGLNPSSVYHFRVSSEDSSGNIAKSSNNVTITPKQSDNALNIVIRGLQDIFNFL